jgi:hypothetical protein
MMSDDELADLDDDLESLYVRRVLSQNAEDVDRVLARMEQRVARWRTHEARRDALAEMCSADLFELACLREEQERADEQRRAERVAWAMDAPALGAYRVR